MRTRRLYRAYINALTIHRYSNIRFVHLTVHHRGFTQVFAHGRDYYINSSIPRLRAEIRFTVLAADEFGKNPRELFPVPAL